MSGIGLLVLARSDLRLKFLYPFCVLVTPGVLLRTIPARSNEFVDHFHERPADAHGVSILPSLGVDDPQSIVWVASHEPVGDILLLEAYRLVELPSLLEPYAR